MNWFQYMALPVATILFLRALRRCSRRGRGRGVAFMTMLLWLAAGVTIAWPGLTTRIAGVLGIGRGADLLLYILALVFAGSALYFYSRIYHLESSLTALVRAMAIREGLERYPAHPGSEQI